MADSGQNRRFSLEEFEVNFSSQLILEVESQPNEVVKALLLWLELDKQVDVAFLGLTSLGSPADSFAIGICGRRPWQAVGPRWTSAIRLIYPYGYI